METGPLLQGLPGGFAFPLTRPRRGKSPGSLESERRRGMCRTPACGKELGLSGTSGFCAPLRGPEGPLQSWARRAS